MNGSMALSTQSNQVVQFVVSECTSEPDVMNFELSCASAVLTSPAISLENLPAKRSVGIRLKLNSRTPRPD